MTDLEVMNYNVKGKLPFKLHFREDELLKFINKSSFTWQYIEESKFRRLSCKIDETTVQLYFTGSLLIINPGDYKNASKIYDKIMQDFKKYCPRIFESQQK